MSDAETAQSFRGYLPSLAISGGVQGHLATPSLYLPGPDVPLRPPSPRRNKGPVRGRPDPSHASDGPVVVIPLLGLTTL